MVDSYDDFRNFMFDIFDDGRIGMDELDSILAYVQDLRELIDDNNKK